jgi:hypothetical protein
MGAVSLEVVPVNSSNASLPLSLDQLHARFLAIVPRIELHAHISFRDVTCAAQKDDWSAETVALCWKWFVRLAEQGQDATEFVSALAGYATRAVRSGRRLCGQEKARDVLSSRAQRRHPFTICRLPDHSGRNGSALEEKLQDNTQAPILDQVVFRLDFPRWRRTRTERDRRLLHDLMVGERTRAVSQKYGLSPGRVSQLRRELRADWDRFCASAAAGR